MSKDWKKIARASGMAIPDSSLEGIAQPLDSLEADLRPLIQALDHAAEPAVTFQADPENGQ